MKSIFSQDVIRNHVNFLKKRNRNTKWLVISVYCNEMRNDLDVIVGILRHAISKTYSVRTRVGIYKITIWNDNVNSAVGRWVDGMTTLCRSVSGFCRGAGRGPRAGSERAPLYNS